MQQRRVNFHTLGCKLNFSESSTLAREFEEGGFVRVAPDAEADICVVNSCSVTEHADKKCRNLIRKLHRRNPGAIIAVTGCYAQLKPQEIAAIEGVDIVLGNNDKGDLYKRVLELPGKGRAQVYSCDADSLTSFFAAFSSGDRTRAFLKVQASVATRRAAELEALCAKLHGAFCARAVGSEDSVLFESTRRGGMMFGFTGNYRRVKAPYDKARVNTVCRVRLGAMDESHDLMGEIRD